MIFGSHKRPAAIYRLQFLVAAACFSVLFPAVAYHESWVKHEYPQDAEKWWWDDNWWDQGQINIPRNYAVEKKRVSFKSGDIDVPAWLFRPKGADRFPGVYFQHGRRGIDELTILHPQRLAARGFIVLAPDLWFARFIDKYPIEHDYFVEDDVARGIEYLASLPEVSTEKICTVSHTRGGYLTLKALVTKNKQENEVACYVSYYPHMQDPNLPEPMQVYRYAPEAEQLRVPALIFFGEHEQYQRYRPIMEAAKALREKGGDIRIIVYPGVGRGFDFRPPAVRTFADDLASKDAMLRTAEFIRRHLGTEQK